MSPSSPASMNRLQARDVLVPSPALRDHQLLAGLASRVHHLLRLGGVAADRLLADDVLAGVERDHGRVHVRVVRCADVHRVDLRHLQQLVVVSELVRHVELLRGLLHHVFLDVAHRQYLHIRLLLQEPADVRCLAIPPVPITPTLNVLLNPFLPCYQLLLSLRMQFLPQP